MSKLKKINLGSLKLPKNQAELFLEAVEYYGFEGTALSLRRFAESLIKHYERRDKIVQPLELKTHQNAVGGTPT